jgi:hypothetical protein
MATPTADPMQIPIAIPTPNLLFVFIIPVLLMGSFYSKNFGFQNFSDSC